MAFLSRTDWQSRPQLRVVDWQSINVERAGLTAWELLLALACL